MNDKIDDASIIQLVSEARKIQANRFGNSHTLNSDMPNRDINKFCPLTASARSTLNTAASNLDLSARAYMRCLRVARTIADLEGSEYIRKENISEAVTFRTQNGPAPL